MARPGGPRPSQFGEFHIHPAKSGEMMGGKSGGYSRNAPAIMMGEGDLPTTRFEYGMPVGRRTGWSGGAGAKRKFSVRATDAG